MPSLKLEDHIFRIAENQARLFRCLEERTELGWDWGADLNARTLTFAESGTGRPLLTCPVRLIGSRSDGDGTWLWGWANGGLAPGPELVAGFDAIRAEATAQGRPKFAAADAFPVADRGEAFALAITAAGALGAFTFYAGGYEGGAAYLAVDSCPEAEALRLDGPARLTILTETLAAVPFEHGPALRAYLGGPVGTGEGGASLFPLGDGRTLLSVTFDDLGRIAEMGATLQPEGAP